jgi:hypothetical protein
MDSDKYTGRLVYVRKSKVDVAALTTGTIFTASLYYYYSRVFIHSRNIPRFGAFVLGSWIVSNYWGNILGLNPVHEAILENNMKELAHQAKLKGEK